MLKTNIKINNVFQYPTNLVPGHNKSECAFNPIFGHIKTFPHYADMRARP